MKSFHAITMMSKIAFVLLIISAAVKSGYIQSGSYPFYFQQTFHPSTTPTFTHYPHYQSQQLGHHLYASPEHSIQNQFFSVSRPLFVPAQPSSSPLQNQIHQVSSAVAVAVPTPNQQTAIHNNIFAIHSTSARPVQVAQERKIVLPLIHVKPNYSFGYAVRDASSGDHKSHQETRTGDNVVGKYTVVEPDGSLRVVSYTSGKEGFKAVVDKIPGYARPNAPEANNQVVAVASRPVNFIPGSSFAVPVSSVPPY